VKTKTVLTSLSLLHSRFRKIGGRREAAATLKKYFICWPNWSWAIWVIGPQLERTQPNRRQLSCPDIILGVLEEEICVMRKSRGLKSGIKSSLFFVLCFQNSMCFFLKS